MVLADGCFDPVHVGHVMYLKSAGTYGAPLTVRVAPDADILEKGRVPYQDHAERLVTMIALRMVDAVVATPTLAEAILEYKPTHLVKGHDWQGKLPDEVYAACLAVGAQIVFVNTQSKTSRERLGA